MPRAFEIRVMNRTVWSSCRRYRYSLTRSWFEKDYRLLFLMQNPSRACEIMNDETVMECQNLTFIISNDSKRSAHVETVATKLPRFGAFRVCNLYPALGTTDWDTDVDPSILRENDAEIRKGCQWADYAVICWGGGKDIPAKKFARRAREVKDIIGKEMDAKRVLCFYKNGKCLHPMGVKGKKCKGLEHTADKMYALLNHCQGSCS